MTIPPGDDLTVGELFDLVWQLRDEMDKLPPVEWMIEYPPEMHRFVQALISDSLSDVEGFAGVEIDIT